jgi:hypothetical protein
VKRRALLLPFLFAVAPVLALFANNAGQARPFEMILPAGMTVLATVLLLPLLALVLRGVFRAAVALSLLWFLVFSYGHLSVLVGGATIGGTSLANPKLLLPVIAAIWIACALAIRRTAAPPAKVAAILFVVAIAMMGTSGFSIAKFYATRETTTRDALLPEEAITARRTERRPDIYYIILDRYGSAQTLTDRYGYDNSPMIEHLRSLGFSVADDSRANYLVTAQSLASSLNVTHITGLTETLGRESKDWIPVFGLLADHRVGRFLKSIGYRYVHMGPEWNATAHNPYADRNYEYRLLPQFSMIFLKTTAAYPILYKFGVGRTDLEKFRRVNYQMEVLGGLAAREERPFFAFAHFLLPHGPFVFNHDGTFRDPATAGAHSEPENYIEQLIFVNDRIRSLVDTIIAAYPSDGQPIIVIQGDEGPYPARTQPHEFDWGQASDEEINEKMRILNAIYAPDCEGLGDARTPVNTFRILFNCLFDTRLPLLPDRSYSYRDQQHLYDFIDVTERINAASR